MFEIIVQYPSEEKKYLFEDNIVKAGRDTTADLVIDDPTISRHQFTIQFEREQYLLIPNPHSTNPIILNGHKLEKPNLLTNQDKIRIGPITLVFLSGNDDNAESTHIYRQSSGSESDSSVSPSAGLEPGSSVEQSPDTQDRSKPTKTRRINPILLTVIIIILVVAGLKLAIYIKKGGRSKSDIAVSTVQRVINKKVVVSAPEIKVECSLSKDCLKKALKNYNQGKSKFENRDLAPDNLYKSIKHLKRARAYLTESLKLQKVKPPKDTPSPPISDINSVYLLRYAGKNSLDSLKSLLDIKAYNQIDQIKSKLFFNPEELTQILRLNFKASLLTRVEKIVLQDLDRVPFIDLINKLQQTAANELEILTRRYKLGFYQAKKLKDISFAKKQLKFIMKMYPDKQHKWYRFANQKLNQLLK